jgi:alanyl-tRNA synthetase
MNHPSAQVRSAFLEFFKKQGHEVCASAALVPQNDPTLMFVNAGMVPFKDVFTGKETRSFTRATSSQKCIRISGKHNDLENVGVTARHHTFFEMLGNFSFGDYFKEEAIAFAWELLTKGFDLPKDRLVITIFGGDGGHPALTGDEEARALWKKVTGFGDDRILGMGMKDNFWQMGETGPCGPCSEIHFFHGDGPSPATFGEEPTAAGHGWTEIWNLVFMQFERRLLADGGFALDRLPKPSVDTGMGLERISGLLQGKTSNYDTDLLRPLVDKASEISGKPYRGTQADDDTSMRVIADHARTTAFLVAEGVFPDRAGREYVLRRVMRRAIRHGHRLGIAKPFLHEVTETVIEQMGDAYPELRARKDLIVSVTQQEEVRFRETLERGLKLLEEEVVTAGPKGRIQGAAAFKLYDTFGFPPDLTQVMAEERGLTVDMEGYDRALEEQRARSEGSKVGSSAVEGVWRQALEKMSASGTSATRFTGYDREEGKGKVLAIVKGSELVQRANAGDEVAVMTDISPFYGEAGGQVGDRGEIRGSVSLVEVTDTQKPITGVVAHHGKVREGTLSVGDEVTLEVDSVRRSATRRNHSATHLLHWALRVVLGEQAAQKGSLVAPDRLRFDFSYGKGLTAEEVSRVEDLVNAKVLTNAPVLTEVLPIDQAKARGAMAIFEEKYGDVVRVLTMTPDSVELCGGTHARALGDIGLFKIISEGGVAAGVRRIEAATGLNALAYVRELEGTLRTAAKTLRSGTADVPVKLDRLVERERQLEKEVVDLKRKLAQGGGGATGGVDDRLADARVLGGGRAGRALAVRVDGLDAAMMREVAEQSRDKLGDSVVLVASVQGPKVQLVVAVSKALVSAFKAGDIVKQVAAIVGGSGGGRPDMAQAGGTDIEKVDEAIACFYALTTE